MKRILALIPLVLVFVLTLAIGSQNGQLVQFNYLIAQGEFPLSMLLGFFFAGGFLLGWLVFGLLFLRLKLQNRTLSRTMRRQSRELELARSPAKE
ncbi:LapA family protein [Aeromonas rivipollensis]|uniref:LapA family protein n=1 Tax=Aeromonas TaxID=642 RepID=UPI00259EB050|nr:lipopolysaccharide assembly protein LapA domain-containing protein [Aeromonas rivipollensis]MDM5059586.1 lipopolysaccharide assembly protein LapA domain-containing protein [Aeromonas rivipollensis]